MELRILPNLLNQKPSITGQKCHQSIRRLGRGGYIIQHILHQLDHRKPMCPILQLSEETGEGDDLVLGQFFQRTDVVHLCKDV